MRSKHLKRRRFFISGLEVDKVAKEDERRSVVPGLVVGTFGMAWEMICDFANQYGIQAAP